MTLDTAGRPDIVPEKGDAFHVGGKSYRIMKIEAGVTTLREGLGKKGRATHRLITLETIARTEDGTGWIATGELIKIGGRKAARKQAKS